MGSEFWAAIAGAVVGGGTAALLQHLALEHATRERRRAAAYSLLFKVGQIYSHLRGLDAHFDKALKGASTEQLANPWGIVEGMSGSPPNVTFAAEEVSLVLELGAAKTLNDLLALDEKHNATFGGFEFYGQKRMELIDALVPEQIDGHQGIAVVPMALKPRAIALNRAVSSLREYIHADTLHALDVLQQLATIFAHKLNVKYAAMPKPEPAAKAPDAEAAQPIEQDS